MADHECVRCIQCDSCPVCAADALDREVMATEAAEARAAAAEEREKILEAECHRIETICYEQIAELNVRSVPCSQCGKETGSLGRRLSGEIGMRQQAQKDRDEARAALGSALASSDRTIAAQRAAMGELAAERDAEAMAHERTRETVTALAADVSRLRAAIAAHEGAARFSRGHHYQFDESLWREGLKR